jgi:hypothetical protein
VKKPPIKTADLDELIVLLLDGKPEPFLASIRDNIADTRFKTFAERIRKEFAPRKRGRQPGSKLARSEIKRAMVSAAASTAYRNYQWLKEEWKRNSRRKYVPPDVTERNIKDAIASVEMEYPHLKGRIWPLDVRREMKTPPRVFLSYEASARINRRINSAQI